MEDNINKSSNLFNDIYNYGSKEKYYRYSDAKRTDTKDGTGVIYRGGEKVDLTKSDASIYGPTLRKIMASNGFFSKKSIANNQYIKFNRFGYVNPYNTRTANKEYLFFTKPDLNIFGGDDQLINVNATASTTSLNPKLAEASTLFCDAATRYFPVLKQLQYNADTSNPFMYLLSNTVSSTLELPGISSENNESSANAYGTTISYRGHSIKSDQACTFSLSFNDTSYLEVYMLSKLYDEYHRLIKLGRIQPKTDYILNRILDDQFSIYKFVLAEDAETLLYWAKVTGVYITDVPRADFSEFPQDGVKFSLSFYGQFVEDMDPIILNDFNKVCNTITNSEPQEVYNTSLGIVNNNWVAKPQIVQERNNSRRADDELGDIVYKMKWYN